MKYVVLYMFEVLQALTQTINTNFNPIHISNRSCSRRIVNSEKTQGSSQT